ncbi:mucin-2 [Erythrolamprus reginae]|uniref:mucin-2 n=1 Tax=Erythrolamprus reginae TaxID=121349 RepID=UPI00396CCD88
MGPEVTSLFLLGLVLCYASEIKTVRKSNHGHFVCSTWGNNHFKTFDGDFYQFPGVCDYNFASDCRESYKEFSVHIQREQSDQGHPNIQYVLVTIKDVAIYLTHKMVTVDERIVKTPYYGSGVLIEMNNIYTKVYAKVGLILIWNQADALMIELDSKFNNYTCGLCGDYNGQSIYNEFISDGLSYNSITFGNLQKVNKPGTKCVDPDETKPIELCKQHREECESLLTSPAFADCQNRLNLELYVQACMQDRCACQDGKDSFCACSTISEYSRQCSHAGGRPQNWRTPQLCPRSCPKNMIYLESGSPCMDTCSHPEISNLCEEHYMDGCFCPNGTIYDDITGNGCVLTSQCHCKLHGKIYSPGQQIANECEECICQSGRWRCEALPCPSTCALEGGSHITTFDGKKYTFHGDCYYVLSKTTKNDTHVLLGELGPCTSSEKQTCLKTVVLLADNRKNVVVFKSDGTILLNDLEIHLPYRTGSFSVFQPSSFYTVVHTNYGLKMQIQLAPVMQLFLIMEDSSKGTLQGLCGDYNGIEYDDLKTSGGVVEATGASFANSWKAQASCNDMEDKLEHPCSLSLENEKYAEYWCSLLKSAESPFARCHSVIEPMDYYKRCKYDTCNCNSNEQCLCAALSSYARDCASKGVMLWGWRNVVCNKEVTSCPANQVFHYNLTTCQQSCRSLSEGDKYCLAGFSPVDGCGCPDNTYVNEKGICVSISDCSCHYKDFYAQPGESVMKDDKRCVCRNGRFHCITVDIRPHKCPSNKTYFDCNNYDSWSYQTPIRLSCQTLGTDHFQTDCISGCFCPDGLIDDGQGNCVEEDDCPCIHNQEFYPNGETINVDCNTCTCQKGSWKCTNKACHGTCTIYGSGHFITFDGKFYDFDGHCEYVASQDYCDNQQGTFSVITENVPCGTTGVTCSKAIKLFLGTTELKLQEKHIEKIEWTNHSSIAYWIRGTVGLYTVIEASNGVMVIWDKKTTIFIKLMPYHKGKVCGLCGNFDDKASNDFTTRSMAQDTVSALAFGNSWKKDPACPDVDVVIEPCLEKPHRKAWAEKECSLIKSDVFKLCHHKVNPEPYYEACVHDACACDSGGDCECFCTAVAAYAHECVKADACIHWRTPDICPIFCEYYNPNEEVCEWHYEPCGRDILTCKILNQVTTNFSVPFLEGCYPRCPPEYPVYNEETKLCGTKEACGCYYNDTYYPPGSPIPNYEPRELCHSCYCESSGNVKCEPRNECCIYDGKEYEVGEIVVNKTEHCMYLICTLNGTMEIKYDGCSTPTTASTTITSTITTSTTIPVSSTTVSTTGTSTIGTTSCIDQECKWSGWISVTKPQIGPDGGDNETYENIKLHNISICDKPENISCRAKNFEGWSFEDLQQKVTCDVSIGLICKNKDQVPGPAIPAPVCLDYEINVCCPVECFPTTPQSTTTTITTTPSTPTPTPTPTTPSTTEITTTIITTTPSTTTPTPTPTTPSTTESTTTTITTTPTPTPTTPSTTESSTTTITTTPSTTTPTPTPTITSTTEGTTTPITTTPTPTPTTPSTTESTTTTITTTPSTTTPTPTPTITSTTESTTTTITTTPTPTPTSTTPSTTESTTTTITTTPSTTTPTPTPTTPSTTESTTTTITTTPTPTPTTPSSTETTTTTITTTPSTPTPTPTPTTPSTTESTTTTITTTPTPTPTTPSTTESTTTTITPTPTPTPTSTTPSTTESTTTTITTTPSTTTPTPTPTTPSTTESTTTTITTTPTPTPTTPSTTESSTTTITTTPSTTTPTPTPTITSTTEGTTTPITTTPTPTPTTPSTTESTTTTITTTPSTTTPTPTPTITSTTESTTTTITTTPTPTPTSTTPSTTESTTTTITTTPSTTTPTPTPTTPSTTESTTTTITTTPTPTPTTPSSTETTTTTITTTPSTTTPTPTPTTPSTTESTTTTITTTPTPTPTTPSTTESTTTTITTTPSTTTPTPTPTTPSTTESTTTTITPTPTPTSTTPSTTESTTTTITTTPSTTTPTPTPTTPSTTESTTTTITTTPTPTPTTPSSTETTTTTITTTPSTTTPTPTPTTPSTTESTTTTITTTPTPTPTTPSTTESTTTTITTTPSTPTPTPTPTTPSTTESTTTTITTTPTPTPTSTTPSTTESTTTTITTTPTPTPTTPSTIESTTTTITTTPTPTPTPTPTTTSTTGSTTTTITTTPSTPTPTSTPTTTSTTESTTTTITTTPSTTTPTPTPTTPSTIETTTTTITTTPSSPTTIPTSTTISIDTQTPPIPTTGKITVEPCKEGDKIVQPGESGGICNCTELVCITDNQWERRPVKCENTTKPTCANGLAPIEVLDENGCCPHWECDCYCTGWGDPHYMTFDGLYYSYQGNCTYVLMEEIIQTIYNFGVYIDNYHCDPSQSVSCTRTLTVKHESQEVQLKTVKLVPLKVEVTVNHVAVALPYEKYSLKVYKAGINHVVELSRLKINVTYNGLAFTIRMPYSTFANNTQGQCGKCNNDIQDDCMLRNGTVIPSCEIMADDWIIYDPEKPHCEHMPPSPPTINPTCKPSQLCKLLQESLFQKCHDVVDVKSYYEACVFDSCRMPNQLMECASLQIYAATCADQGICIDWRGHTEGACPINCPSNKVYKACGPAVEETCKSGSTGQSQTQLMEGCFCPDGTTLYDPAIDVCVETCGCVGPDNIPREYGESFMFDCKDCICLEGGNGIICEPHKCPVPDHEVQCEGEGYQKVIQVNPDDKCCSDIVCVCNTTQCTTKPPQCDPGFIAVANTTEGHCCPFYQCHPKKVCVKDGNEYQPGSEVLGNKCEKCKCTNQQDSITLLNIIECKDIPCNVKCQQGYSPVVQLGDCCATCVQTSCVIRTIENNMVILKPGESRNDPKDNCTIYSCTMIHKQLVSSTSVIKCPMFDENRCQPGTIVLLPNGCCKTCILMSDTPSCSATQTMDYINYDGCRSEEQVPVTQCEGRCGTFSIYSPEANSMTHKCSCCRESKTAKKEITLLCADGIRKKYRYIHIERCDCLKFGCGGQSSSEEYSENKENTTQLPQQEKALERVRKALRAIGNRS